MQTFLQAIYTNVTATSGTPTPIHNAFYTAVGGRFYFSYAPEDAIFPYSLYHIITTDLEYEFTEQFQRAIVQFDIYSQSPSSSEALTASGYLKTLFDMASFTITGYSISFVERTFETIDFYSDDQVWQYAVHYNFLLKKS